MSAEINTKLDWIREEIHNLKEAGLYNRIRTLSSPKAPGL
jgi:hypothetical protein